MIKTYFNQPNPHVTIHRFMGCGFVTREKNQATYRAVNINMLTLGREMSKFERGEWRFAAQAGLNGLWVNVNLGSYEKEKRVILEIIEHLGRKYKAFRGIVPTEHC